MGVQIARLFQFIEELWKHRVQNTYTQVYVGVYIVHLVFWYFNFLGTWTFVGLLRVSICHDLDSVPVFTILNKVTSLNNFWSSWWRFGKLMSKVHVLTGCFIWMGLLCCIQTYFSECRFTMPSNKKTSKSNVVRLKVV